MWIADPAQNRQAAQAYPHCVRAFAVENATEESVSQMAEEAHARGHRLMLVGREYQALPGFRVGLIWFGPLIRAHFEERASSIGEPSRAE